MNPTPTTTHHRFDEAFARHREGDHVEALRLYERVLAVDPRHAPALHYSALLLHQAGVADKAIARIERSLAIDDRVSDAWSNAGLIYMGAGRGSDAARAFERALEIEPTLSEAWVNLSSLRLAMDDAGGAEAAARHAVAIGRSPNAVFNLALALAAQGRHDEVLAALDRLDASGAVAEDDAAVPGLRAQSLMALGRPDAAQAVLDRALSRIDDATLRIERARLSERRRDTAAAEHDYFAALRLEPEQETALSELVFMKKRSASWDGLAALQARFAARVASRAKSGEASALTPFSFLSDPSTRGQQRAAAEAWSRRWLDHPVASRPLSADRLRIGYLSSDLHEHATGVLAVGLFERHDRSRFEVFAYSTGPDDGSALRRRLVAAFDRFVDARGWSDDRIAEAVRADGIDILVDLKGHTDGAPTGVMALRPAPIAVSYLGYPGTMGAPFIDYLIGDRVVVPLAERHDYRETLVQLPFSYQVTDDRREIGVAPSRADLGLPDDAVVFCCFNNPYKLTPDVFDAWAEVLRQVPDGVLWMLTRRDDDGLHRRLKREAAIRGIEPERVVFAHTRPHAEYLALYRRADLFVDTWPYNAHTTASDALWAGCPVLTFAGTTFAGRVAASLLTAARLPEGIAADRADYVARAIAWGRDREALAALRARLERDVKASPLFDTAGTTRHIEAAYLAMRQRHGAGHREPIVIDPPPTNPS